MDLSAMTSKCKNGGYGVGTFVQKIVKTELIRYKLKVKKSVYIIILRNIKY